MVRAEVESGDTPAGLEGAKMLMLVNRESGKGLGVTLFESEDAMRRGDEALNAMNLGASEQRTSVESLPLTPSDERVAPAHLLE